MEEHQGATRNIHSFTHLILKFSWNHTDEMLPATQRVNPAHWLSRFNCQYALTETCLSIVWVSPPCVRDTATICKQRTSENIIFILKDFLQLILICRTEHSEHFLKNKKKLPKHHQNLTTSLVCVALRSKTWMQETLLVNLKAGLIRLNGGHMLDSILSIIPITRSEICG